MMNPTSFFKSFVAMLPAVSGSREGVAVGIATLACAAYTFHRTSRFGKLMKVLPTLPAADRARALEIETGSKLPKNLTAEQWIKARRDGFLFATFMCFILGAVLVAVLTVKQIQDERSPVPPTFIVRGHDSGDEPSVPPIHSQTQQSTPAKSSADGGELFTVTYAHSDSSDRVRLTPVIPYRDLFRAGGPVPGVDAEGPFFRWDYPVVEILVHNPGQTSLLVSEALIDVIHAEPVNEVLVVFDDLSQNNLVMRNAGWAEVRNGKLMLDVAPEAACANHPVPGNGAVQVVLPAFADAHSISVLPYVRAALRSQRTVCVFGTLEFDEPMGGRRKVTYQTRVRLGVRVSALVPVSARYTVMLNPEGGPTHIAVPVSQLVDKADRFLLALGSKKSGKFSLELTLVHGDARKSPKTRIDVEIFVPRGAPNLTARSHNQTGS